MVVVVEFEGTFDGVDHFVAGGRLGFFGEGGGAGLFGEEIGVGSVDGFEVDEFGTFSFAAVVVEDEDGHEAGEEEGGLHDGGGPEHAGEESEGAADGTREVGCSPHEGEGGGEEENDTEADPERGALLFVGELQCLDVGF